MRAAKALTLLPKVPKGFPSSLKPYVKALWDTNLKVDAMCKAPNIIPNGDYSNGLTGWTSVGGALTLSNGVAICTGSGISEYVGPTSPPSAVNLSVGKKFYCRVMARSKSSLCTNLLFSIYKSDLNYAVAVKTQPNPVVDQWYTISNVVTVVNDATIFTATAAARGQFATAANANGAVIEVGPVFMLCLTDIFGAGNEPTLTEIEDILTKSPIETVTKTFDQLCSNGDFLNLTGWSIGANTSISLSNGEATFRVSAQYAGPVFPLPIAKVVQGHVYYARIWIKSNTSLVRFALSRASGYDQHFAPAHTGSGNYELISGLVTINGPITDPRIGILDYRSSGWDDIKVKGPLMFFDLTEVFGRGKEPTKTEMDDLTKNLNYFTGLSALQINMVTKYWNGVKNIVCNPGGKYFLADTIGKILPIYGSLNQLVTNGDFVLDSNADGMANNFWPIGTLASKRLFNGAQAFTAGASLGGISYAPSGFSNGDVLYVCAKVTAPYATVRLGILNATATQASSLHSSTSGTEFMSALWKLTSAPNSLTAYVRDESASGFVEVRVDDFMIFNLTQIFGAGNELIRPQMDSILQKIGVYFEGQRSNVLLNPGEEGQFGQGHHLRLWNMAYTPSSGPQENPAHNLSDGSDDWIGRAEDFLIPANTSFSMSWLVSRPSGTNLLTMGYCFTDSFTSGGVLYSRFYPPSTELGVVMYDQITNSGYDCKYDITITNGVWYNITFTYNADTKVGNLYLNGILVKSDLMVNSGARTINFYRVCRDSGGNSYYNQKNAMDCIFDRDLTSSEVRQLYNSYYKRYGMSKI